MNDNQKVAPVVNRVARDRQSSDFAYWQSCPPAERIAALEEIRHEYHQWKYHAEPRLQEFLQSLNDNDVRYLLIGGYAVAFHGHPRYTKDLDVWIEMTAGNANRVIEALKQFGFGSLGLTSADFVVPDQIIQLGYLPNRIDILTTAPGSDFETCYQKRVTANIDGLAIEFIDIESLKQNKKASGRYQDLADIENLE
jgi:Zn/Cd-binding protein ZinT